MDFMSRGSRPGQTNSQPAGNTTSGTPSPAGAGDNKKGGKQNYNIFHLSDVALVFSIAILILAVAGSIFIGKPTNEYSSVDKEKMQAVFLNGGQVYFGRVRGLNPQFMRLYDIYYLRVNQQVQPGQTQNQGSNDVSLVKLGCELHGPTDEMVINREQVIFWENLKTDGQVAKAVEEYKKQNPDGQKCDQPQQGGATQQAPQQQAPATQTPPAATPPANNRR